VKRRLLAFCAALSLLLFAATVVVWVRSHRACDAVGWGTVRDVPAGQMLELRGVGWGGGRVCFVSAGDLPADVMSDYRGWFHLSQPPHALDRPRAQPSALNQLGFYLILPPSERGVIVPAWFLALGFAVLPVVAAVRWGRRRRSRRTGSCVRCGYDLTGNVSGTCPECGSLAAEGAAG
jgi:hypothetical protein